ncbi:hypothetical protein DBR32_05920 [Taibaiella sp. KBW10]|uniref:hypothetical protein n=1 Tax=Taibaiella sp. KBW10 TaxID=2153357 RepID=UPI000F5AE434|nr:hypothetical protein [Taibaiella sp. KBW10]RQO31493.1 hypothetical protein DBR32_05920 [Taibaiella sp. KBW10]
MQTVDILKIVVLVLLATVAIMRWVRFFKAKKRGEDHQFTRFESISVLVLMLLFLYLTLWYK